MARVLLRELCHSRAGDKGDISNLALIVYDKKNFGLIRDQITAERVKRHFGELVKGEVNRYELTRMGAFNFVMHEALDGGTTRSLRIDGYGKSLSAFLLAMEIDLNEEGSTPSLTQQKKVPRK